MTEKEIREDVYAIPEAELERVLSWTYFRTWDKTPEETELYRKYLNERIQAKASFATRDPLARKRDEEWLVSHRNDYHIQDIRYFFQNFYRNPYLLGNGNYYLDNLINILADCMKEVIDSLGGWLPAEPFKAIFWERISYDSAFTNVHIEDVYEDYFKRFGDLLLEKVMAKLVEWKNKENRAFEVEAAALSNQIEAQFMFGCKEVFWAAVSAAGGKLAGKVVGRIRSRNINQLNNITNTVNETTQRQLAQNAVARNPVRARELSEINHNALSAYETGLLRTTMPGVDAHAARRAAVAKFAQEQALTTERILANEESMHMMQQAINAANRNRRIAKVVSITGEVGPGVLQVSTNHVLQPFKENHKVAGREFNIFVEIIGETGDMIIGFIPIAGTAQSLLNIVISAGISIGGKIWAVLERRDHNNMMEEVEKKNRQIFDDLHDIIMNREVESLVRSVAVKKSNVLWQVQN